MNYFQLLQTGLALAYDGYKQSAFINRFLKPLVKKHCDRLGYTLSPSEKKKVLFYYPMYTVLACGQMYISVKGRKLTAEENKRLTLVGAMATICDDLVDEDNWTRDQIFHLLSTDLDVASLMPKAQLLVSLNNELKNFWPLSATYFQQLKTALEWQAVSQNQADPNIPLAEIVHICREKNGHTSLMFSTLIDEAWTEPERAFIYQSAIVGQLTNDSFDLYFDTQNGIQTYFNTATDMAQARDFFLTECRQLHQFVMACNTTEKNKTRAINRMSILHAFTLTALDQFIETQQKHGIPIDWKAATRKDMVIDMAKNKNRFKTVKHMIWLSKQ